MRASRKADDGYDSFSNSGCRSLARRLPQGGPKRSSLQKLASWAYQAANRLLLGTARHVRIKGRNQLDSVEGKKATVGIRWCGDRVEWMGLVLPARIDPCDPVIAHGLAYRVKDVRLVRRKLGEQNRFHAQLICEGTPYRKDRHTIGEGVVGLDLGPQTIAFVSEHQASLQPFCPDVVPNTKQLRRLDQQLDRQRRANNPENYDERGRVKHGKKQWKISQQERRTKALSLGVLSQARGHTQAGT